MTKLRSILLRRWPILAVTLLVGLLAGFLSTSRGSARQITFFEAKQVIVANRGAGNPANVAQDALKVTRGEVPERAAELFEESAPQGNSREFGDFSIDASAKDESNSITLKVADPDPELASLVTQAYTTAFLEIVNADLQSEDTRLLEELRRRLVDAEAALDGFDSVNGFITRPDVQLPQTQSIDALVAERQQLQQDVQTAKAALNDAELAVSSREPYSTLGVEEPKVADAQLIEIPDSPLFRMGLLGTIGLLLGAGLVTVIERVNQRIDSREELADLLDVPIVAEIGRVPRKFLKRTEGQPINLEGVWSEHYRRVRSAIQFVQADATTRLRTGAGLGLPASQAVISSHRAETGRIPRVFMFVSALPSDGKSTSVALTAQALAEVGESTVVVNADFRRPKIEKYLGVPRTPSLADMAVLDVHRPSVDEVVQATDSPYLWVAAAGPPSHEVSGRLTAAKEVAAVAASRGATVLIDSSPLRVSNDPIDLLSSVDEVVLVVRAGKTTVKSIEDTMNLLAVHHAPVLGVVLIGTLGTREMYAYYQSYYRSLEPEDVAPGVDAPAGAAPVNGHAVNGHAVNGQAVNGQAVNGHAVNGHAVNGQAVNGQAVNGQAVTAPGAAPGPPPWNGRPR